uniref:GUN3 n=1 Tax=Arundo donax TaxID=35708 RepID=A0A0A9CYN0_ARUDO
MAAPGDQEPDVPELHPGERSAPGRRRAGQHVRVGQQARRRSDTHLQVVPGAAPGRAARVQGPRRQLHLLHGARHADGPDAVHPGRPAVQAQRQQHAVRDLQRLPPAHLRQVPRLRQADRHLRRRHRHAAPAPRHRPAAGGLPAGEQPDGDVLHGGLRRQVPAPDPPPRVVAAVRGRAPGQDPVLAGVHCALLRRGQPQRPHRRRRGRAEPAGPVPRPAERPRALGAGHLHQRAARRRARVPRALLRPALASSDAWSNESLDYY